MVLPATLAPPAPVIAARCRHRAAPEAEQRQLAAAGQQEGQLRQQEVERPGRFLAGEDLEGTFDGHANCFVETGFHKALLIDFNTEVEPLPGRYPEGHVGPLPLLKESRMNHLGKLLFQWVYWHVLLPGHDVPGVSSRLQMSGKHIELLKNSEGDPR